VWIHDADASFPPKSGTWTITLSTTGSSVVFDGWLDSDLGGSKASFPNGNTNKTVGMPGTAAGAITAASYVTKWSWTDYRGESLYYGDPDRTGNISTFSSIGPTADDRQKPDIAAPGQGIVAALSSFEDTTGLAENIVTSNKYQLMQGTSMATPHVTGAAALLLGAKPSLTADQIKSYFSSAARTDAFTSTVWNTTWGNGKMDIYKAMASAVDASGSSRAILSYYSGTQFGYTVVPATNPKVAMRFTPTINGKLMSVSVNINGGANAIKGTGNLKASATQSIKGSTGFIPGAQIGTSVLVPLSSLNPGVANVIDFSSAGVSVTSGIDFQIVLEDNTNGDSLQLFLDNNTDTSINRTSSYRTGANDIVGWYNRSDPNYATSYTKSDYNLFITAEIAVPVTDVRLISNAVPTTYSLKQNYPNPFNPSTNVEYSIPVKGLVKLRIYDILGRSIATLVNATQEAGVYHATWDGKAAASGVYFYKLESGSFSKTERMLLLK
jgi:hypothetical protein